MAHRSPLMHQFRLAVVALTAACVMGGCDLKQNDTHHAKRISDKDNRKNITILHAFIEKAAVLEKKEFNIITIASVYSQCHSALTDPAAPLSHRTIDSLAVTGNLNLALYYQMGVQVTHSDDKNLNHIRDTFIKEARNTTEPIEDQTNAIKATQIEINALRKKYQHKVDSLVNATAETISRYNDCTIAMGDHVKGSDGVFRQILFYPGH